MSQALQRIKSAVEHERIASSSGLLQRLFSLSFNGLVYNQIWEDPEVDALALGIDSNSRILTIASAGCNVLNYLVHSPASITAVDLNPAHMHLTRLKIAALKYLPDYETFFCFFGAAEDKQNISNYHRWIAPQLDRATRRFWEGGRLAKFLRKRGRIAYFSKNFYRHSRSALFLRFAHQVARFSGARPQAMLGAHSLEEQRNLFEQHVAPLFDHWLVRSLSRMPVTVYGLGIPPQQFGYLRHGSKGGVASLYRERVRRLLCDFDIQHNYFAWQALECRYNRNETLALPPYLRSGCYETIKAGVDRVRTSISDLGSFLNQSPDRSFSAFVLLDAQDWMPLHVIRNLWGSILRCAKPGARIIFRSAGVLSPVEAALKGLPLHRSFRYDEKESREFFARDRSAIYGSFHLYSVEK